VPRAPLVPLHLLALNWYIIDIVDAYTYWILKYWIHSSSGVGGAEELREIMECLQGGEAI
jgi:hypothetical protein